MTGSQPSYYYDAEHVETRIAKGQHRELIGGLWDEVGSLQIEFLKSRGLTPDKRLLDIACGSLRLGVRAVEYLDAGNYWGTDINAGLLDSGYDKEITPAGLAGKLPRSQLVADGEFTFEGIPKQFDFAMAQSLFTHLPLNHLRLCLSNLDQHLDGPCTFFVTVFEVPLESAMKPFKQALANTISHPHKDPYHYTPADLEWAAQQTGWRMEYIGEWNHPRSQKIAAFHH